MSVHIDDAIESLNSLIRKYSVSQRNEAQTRFEIIDYILKDVLGWEGLIQVEVHNNSEFTDYELGSPTRMIWEAKREGDTFLIPKMNNKIVKISTLIKGNSNLKNALEQVQGYCANRGVQIGLVTNGTQVVAFLASRLDGVKPLDGRAFVIDSLEDFASDFIRCWNCLSVDGVRRGDLINALTNNTISIPPKISRRMFGYPRVKESDDLQISLGQLSELILQDALKAKEVEADFYRECYCESGPLTQFSLLSKNIINARYDALFNESGNKPQVVPVAKKKGSQFGPEVLAEAAAKRPIVLIGDVGVGKTSFIKNLTLHESPEELANSYYIYIDLGAAATLETDLKLFVINQIERQLSSKSSLNLNSLELLKRIYRHEVSEFESGANSLLKEINNQEFMTRMADCLVALTSNRGQHLKRVVELISSEYKRSVVVFVDNADQRDFDTQQNAFLISQELASSWGVLCFIAVRPSTFFKSKAHGALAAYPHKVFSISPPKLEDALIKRLVFALNILDGRTPISTLQGLTLNIRSLTNFLKIIQRSIRENKELLELIVNISGGNVRVAIDLLIKYLGSPHIDSTKIIKLTDDGEEYIIPTHEFAKVVLLGDYVNYNPDYSVVANLFDVNIPDGKYHFLKPVILALLKNHESIKDRDGYVQVRELVSIMQGLGFIESTITDGLVSCINKKIIETNERITLEEAINDYQFSMVRITSAGAYHLQKMLMSFTYMDAVWVDTPIVDEEVREEISKNLDDNTLLERYRKAEIFKNYIYQEWNNSGIQYMHFSLDEYVEHHNQSFSKVYQALLRLGKINITSQAINTPRTA